MVTCIRYFVMIMLSSPVVMKRIEIEHPFPIGKRWLLIWRGIIAASYMIINYYAIQVRKQKSEKIILLKGVSDLETLWIILQLQEEMVKI